MRVCFAIAALALLACAQGCGESARPVATPLTPPFDIMAMYALYQVPFGVTP